MKIVKSSLDKTNIWFTVVCVFIFMWIQTWLRLYPSWLFFSLQTTLILLGRTLLIQPKRPLWLGAAVAVLFGWVISISSHQLLSAVFVDNFFAVWDERVDAGKTWSHLWFVAYSSLLFAGPVQSLALYVLKGRTVHDR